MVLKFPRSSLERSLGVVQSTDGAQIDGVSRELISENLLNVRRDFVRSSSSYLADSVLSSDLLSESDASGAVDASGHSSFNNRAEDFVFDGVLVLHHSAFSVAVDNRDVLQVALSALIADGAVERMVGQDHFHRGSSSEPCFLGLSFHLEIGSHVGGACGDGFGRPFDFDEAHSAVSRDAKTLMEAEPGDLDTSFVSCLNNGVRGVDCNGLFINVNLELLVEGLGGLEHCRSKLAYIFASA